MSQNGNFYKLNAMHHKYRINRLLQSAYHCQTRYQTWGTVSCIPKSKHKSSFISLKRLKMKYNIDLFYKSCYLCLYDFKETVFGFQKRLIQK